MNTASQPSLSPLGRSDTFWKLSTIYNPEELEVKARK
jgi:hypothetical protein